MSKNIRLLIVAGARPNFMKVAPIIHQIQDRSRVNATSALEFCLVHTGQHYDDKMSSVFFADSAYRNPT